MAFNAPTTEYQMSKPSKTKAIDQNFYHLHNRSTPASRLSSIQPSASSVLFHVLANLRLRVGVSLTFSLPPLQFVSRQSVTSFLPCCPFRRLLFPLFINASHFTFQGPCPRSIIIPTPNKSLQQHKCYIVLRCSFSVCLNVRK